MSTIEEILAFNTSFVNNKSYEQFNTTKYPNKKMAILSCMDTRLTELLPAALNIKNGDVKIIKNAGALINNPFGSVMRSLIVAIYELGIDKILIINHYDCGMQNINPQLMIDKMLDRGINQKDLDLINYFGVDIKNWMKGFDDPFVSVKETIKIIKTHPLIPQDIEIYGFIMDPVTGRLDSVE